MDNDKVKPHSSGNGWRNSLPIIKFWVVGSEVYHRDPFTVTLIKAKVSDRTFTGAGVAKRNRYGKYKDEPDTMLATRISTDRAFKDLYFQLKADGAI